MAKGGPQLLEATHILCDVTPSNFKAATVSSSSHASNTSDISPQPGESTAFKGLCDYIAPAWIIQNNHSIWRSTD